MGGSSSLPPPLANRRLLVFYSLCREYKRAVFQVLGWPGGSTGGGQGEVEEIGQEKGQGVVQEVAKKEAQKVG